MTFILRTTRGLEKNLAREISRFGVPSVAIHSDGQVLATEVAESQMDAILEKSRFVERVSTLLGSAETLEEMREISRGFAFSRLELMNESPVQWTRREILAAAPPTAESGCLIIATEAGNKLRVELEFDSRVMNARKPDFSEWSLFKDPSEPAQIPRPRSAKKSVIAGFIDHTRIESEPVTIFDPFATEAQLARGLSKNFTENFYGAGVSDYADLAEFENSNFKFTKRPFEEMLDRISDPLLLTVIPKNRGLRPRFERLGVACKGRPDFRGLWILTDDKGLSSPLRFETTAKFGNWSVLRWLGRKP